MWVFFQSKQKTLIKMFILFCFLFLLECQQSKINSQLMDCTKANLAKWWNNSFYFNDTTFFCQLFSTKFKTYKLKWGCGASMPFILWDTLHGLFFPLFLKNIYVEFLVCSNILTVLRAHNWLVITSCFFNHLFVVWMCAWNYLTVFNRSITHNHTVFPPYFTHTRQNQAGRKPQQQQQAWMKPEIALGLTLNQRTSSKIEIFHAPEGVSEWARSRRRRERIQL